MAALSGDDARPFNLDAILSEFNVGNEPAPSHPPPDEAVARVRKSLGLGRSIFRRKDSLSEQRKDNELGDSQEDTDAINLSESDDEDAPRTSKFPRRMVDTDDEDGLPVRRPRLRASSPAISITQSPASPSRNGDSDSEDEFSTEKLVEDFRKARAEALASLNAKAAAKSQEEQQDATEDEMSLVSERPHSPARSYARSASPSARRTKTKRMSKKALEDMHRETQRMSRNMALRPEVKVSKKIDMNTIFAKFGYNPTKLTDEKAVELPDQHEQASDEVKEFSPADKDDNSSHFVTNSSAPIRFATPNFDASDSDESLPSPSKLASYLSQMPTKPPTAAPALASKFASPRKVQFTLPPSPSASAEGSDIEILPPPNLLTTHATTPDRKNIKRMALIRSLAGVKSPAQMKKSPGRMTATELDATLTKEAAIQAKRKRDERRAELKSLGIDLEKIVEKRDLLEEAREEARRLREEEGGNNESDDEEYFDDEAENDGDDEETGEESGESTDEDDEMADSDDEAQSEDEDQDEIIQDVSTKRKGRKLQISSDDEDEALHSQDAVIPESTVGYHHSHLGQVHTTDDSSLTQFFRPTQMSDVQQTPAIQGSQPQTSGETTGLTQFFRSTAMEDENLELDEGAAHGQMELLRQQAAKGHPSLGGMTIGLPAPLTTNVPSSRSASPSPLVESSIRRRILKRRAKPRNKPGIAETSDEFLQSKKEFIEEQAEESDDDYKAWGSGDESENEGMDGVVEGLIDDETKIKKKAQEEIARLYMFLPILLHN